MTVVRRAQFLIQPGRPLMRKGYERVWKDGLAIPAYPSKLAHSLFRNGG